LTATDTAQNAQTQSVIVDRNDPKDVGDRQVIVWLDGERIATLLYGEAVEHGLAIGLHRLRFSNTLFWKTVEFDVRAGEHVRFEAINRAGRVTYALLGILGVAPLYLTVRRADVHNTETP
jgi:hypothetical protein